MSIYPKSTSCGTDMGFEKKEENVPDDCFYKIKWKQLNVVNLFFKMNKLLLSLKVIFSFFAEK